MISQDVTAKLEMLSADDYRMVVTLIDRLAEKPSNILGNARNKYVKNNPMTMEEIDREIEKYRGEDKLC